MYIGCPNPPEVIPAKAGAGIQVAVKSSAPLWLCAQIAKYH